VRYELGLPEGRGQLVEILTQESLIGLEANELGGVGRLGHIA
jgi:hypothetical protein